MPKRPTGRCSHCGKKCAIYFGDATIYNHEERDRWGRLVSERCPGSRQAPFNDQESSKVSDDPKPCTTLS